MSKDSLLLFSGILVVVIAFLGIPSSWKTIIFGALGLCIAAIAFLLRKDITSGAVCMHLMEEKETDSYKQNGAIRTQAVSDREQNSHEEVEKATEARA